MSTGKARPALSITGASPSSAATRAPSSVADITSSLQVVAQALLHVARQREAEIGIERALVELVEQHRRDRRRATRSSSTMRVNTPSVTTSMRVARDTLEPNRTR